MGSIASLTSRQHFSRCFLVFVHLIAAVLSLGLVLCGSIVLFKGLEKESILKINTEKLTDSHVRARNSSC